MENTPSSDKSFNRSEYIKKLWESGVFKRKRPPEVKARMSAAMKKNLSTGKAMMPSERFAKTKDPKYRHLAKGPDHYHSKFWKIKSPTGKVIEGFNLSDIVRRHKRLFDPNDLKWRGETKNQCNAVTCIAQLKYLKDDGTPRRSSWKGWKLLLLKDTKTNEIIFEAS